LAGLEYPVNSVGELPLSYIDASPKEKALAALANVQGVLEMYRIKEEQKKGRSLRYKPYPPFTEVNRSPEAQLEAIRRLIRKGKFDQSISRSSSLLHEGLEGLRYLQTYDWLFLRTIVSFGYLGWIAYAITTVIDLHVLQGATKPVRTTGSTIFFSSLLVTLFSALWVQKSSWRYYAYGFFPIFFWEEVVSQRKALTAARAIIFAQVKSVANRISLTFQAIVYIGVLEALVSGCFYLIFPTLWIAIC
jgi:phosphatidylinositol glycan class N